MTSGAVSATATTSTTTSTSRPSSSSRPAPPDPAPARSPAAPAGQSAVTATDNSPVASFVTVECAPARDDRAAYDFELSGTPAVAIVTTALAGDLRPGAPGAATRRDRVLPGPWHWTTQVHGGTVVEMRTAFEGWQATSDSPADGIVSASPAPHLAMFSADCALVALSSPEGVIGLAHCGWRGLLSGVVQAVASEMRRLGATDLVGLRGPCIGPECYEFGAGDLDQVAARYGDRARGLTKDGRPALDLAAGVEVAAAEAGLSSLLGIGGCTACTPGWFSHRGQGAVARQALVVGAAP